MLRLFIDTDDGDAIVEDEAFDGLRHARDAAIATPPAPADARSPDGEHRIFRAVVSDEARATPTYRGEWKIGPPGGET